MAWKVIASLALVALWTCMSDIAEALDCKQTDKGLEYAGTQSTSATGLKCKAWAFYEKNFPEKSFKLAKNYCRNPDGELGGPWCYTDDPSTLWESCDVKICGSAGAPRDCKTSVMAQDYAGTISTTVSGKKCIAWTFLENNMPEKSFVKAQNYCRNPDGEEGGPWCYTEDPNVLWDDCAIKRCSTY